MLATLILVIRTKVIEVRSCALSNGVQRSDFGLARPAAMPPALRSLQIWDHQAMPATRKPREQSAKSREDSARDVLAAEEFGVPAPDPNLHHGPISLPGDPSGIAEPHDVLAAEEFALPAPRRGTGEAADPVQRTGALVRALGATLALLVVRRLLRRPPRA
jgi:hypothetical protein